MKYDSPISLLQSFHKSTDSKYISQQNIFYQYLLNGWHTAREAEVATGITISNLTLYKRDLEKQGLLWTSLNKVKCPITGKFSKQITTSASLVPWLQKQGNLFESKEVVNG